VALVRTDISEEHLFLQESTRRHLAKDGILHSHRCQNLKSYKLKVVYTTPLEVFLTGTSLNRSPIVVNCFLILAHKSNRQASKPLRALPTLVFRGILGPFRVWILYTSLGSGNLFYCPASKQRSHSHKRPRYAHISCRFINNSEL
jgi:hypothetical protein